MMVMILKAKKSIHGQLGFSNLELALLTAVVIVLGSVVIVSYSGVKQKSHNSERKTDITALAAAADQYQALLGQYPTPLQLSDSALMKKTIKTFDAADLQDPLWKPANSFCSLKSQPQLQATLQPHRGCYGYAASPADCDNVNVDCTSYTLTARLETGGWYIKKSID